MADYTQYVLGNPDLRENAEALGLTPSEIAEWGEWHWTAHGNDEGRLNTPDKQDFAPGFTETLGAQHYQGRDVEDVLQASVRSAYGGDFDESMWTARQNLNDDWNLRQFSADEWNLNPDNPYRSGILGNTIAVDTGVGQLYDSGDDLFVQDMYNTGSQANDFLDSWVTDGNWTGPDWGANYWDVLDTATRDADGNLRATIPRADTGWDTSDNNVVQTGVITGGGGGAEGAMDLLAYRPWTQNYWKEYVPNASQGLLKMNKPQRDYGLAYLPGEHRDPVVWGQWADDHKGHIPGGGWRFTPESYTTQTGDRAGKPAPWRFTSGPASATNIYNNPWTARSTNLTPAQGADWAGFLSSIDTSPTITPGLLTTGKGGPITFPA